MTWKPRPPQTRISFRPSSKPLTRLQNYPNMSREAYEVPDISSGSPVNAPQPGGPLNIGDGPAINYLCGDCNAKVPLKRGDPIRCKECGHRVLYKERTKRMVQFEARWYEIMAIVRRLGMGLRLLRWMVLEWKEIRSGKSDLEYCAWSFCFLHKSWDTCIERSLGFTENAKPFYTGIIIYMVSIIRHPCYL